VRVEQNVARALEVADKAPVLVGAGIVREGSAEELRQIEMEKPFFEGNNFSHIYRSRFSIILPLMLLW
jgi:ABC-type lipopolysaccharide export system ATPase subunit